MAEVQRVLDRVGSGTSLIMAGSIIEGFGNQHSDIDLYQVLDEGRPEQAVAIGVRASRYVDCEYFPAAVLQRLSARVASADWRQVESLRDSEVDRYYRLATGVPLATTKLFEPILASFDKQVACNVFARWAALRSWQLVGYGAVLVALGDTRAATLTLRDAALWIGSTELAAEGEGYPSLKWLGEKAARRYGRGSPDFHKVVGDYVRPTGGAAELLVRLRERLPVPAGLAELLDGRCFEVAGGVRLVKTAERRFLVDETRGVATIDGPLAAAIDRLVSGVPWLQATEEVADGNSIVVRELRAGLWLESARLRASGHLVERRFE